MERKFQSAKPDRYRFQRETGIRQNVGKDMLLGELRYVFDRFASLSRTLENLDFAQKIGPLDRENSWKHRWTVP